MINLTIDYTFKSASKHSNRWHFDKPFEFVLWPTWLPGKENNRIIACGAYCCHFAWVA